MSNIDHDEAEVLLAAYALDALCSDDERAAVDGHLAQCGDCRSTLDAYREVAARLTPDVAPPPELWDRLVEQLPPRVVSIEARRRARRPRAWVGVAAAAVALVAGFGVGQLAAGSSRSTVGELAASARDEDGATLLVLAAADGSAAAEAVLTADGRGYLTNRDLPDLAADRSYQLWALRDGQPVSVALLGDDPSVEAFRAPSRFDQLLITDEPAIGSPSPTTAPVARATA